MDARARPIQPPHQRPTTCCAHATCGAPQTPREAASSRGPRTSSEVRNAPGVSPLSVTTAGAEGHPRWRPSRAHRVPWWQTRGRSGTKGESTPCGPRPLRTRVASRAARARPRTRREERANCASRASSVAAGGVSRRAHGQAAGGKATRAVAAGSPPGDLHPPAGQPRRGGIWRESDVPGRPERAAAPGAHGRCRRAAPLSIRSGESLKWALFRIGHTGGTQAPLGGEPLSGATVPSASTGWPRSPAAPGALEGRERRGSPGRARVGPASDPAPPRRVLSQRERAAAFRARGTFRA